MDPTTFFQGAPEGRSRETTIRRDAEGRWYHDGQLLEHPNLMRAFDRWVCRAEDGRYCLKNDINWAYFTLQGAPFFVRAVRPSSQGADLLLSSDAWVQLDPRSLRMGPEGALYCDVQDGMTARFDRHAMGQLEDFLGEDEDGVYLELSGHKVRPRVCDDPLNAQAVEAEP